MFSELYNVASGFEHAYLNNDYMGLVEFGVLDGRTQKAVYHYDLHEHRIMRMDNPKIGYVALIAFPAITCLCRNTIQVIRIANDKQ